MICASAVFIISPYLCDGIDKLDSPAINEAIIACAKKRGGTVFVPAGTYLCGSIRLTNNLHLYLDAGAVILAAPQKLEAYDTVSLGYEWPDLLS